MAFVETDKGSAARFILGMMVPATGIALLGHVNQEIRYVRSSGATKKPTLAPGVGDAQIILGGTLSVVILVLIAQLGDVGARFGKGIAVLALLTSIGLYGGTVATAVTNVVGQTIPQAEGAKSSSPMKVATSKPTTKKGTA